MRLPPLPALSTYAESGTWFRAIQLRFWDPANPLGTRHTKTSPTRFNPGSHPKPGRIGFEILYLRVPNSQILAIFPNNLLAGSWIEFSDPVGGTARRVTGIRTLP